MRWIKSTDKLGSKAISRCKIPDGVTPLFEYEFEAGDQGLADLKVAHMSLSTVLAEGERIEAWPAFIMCLENLKHKKEKPTSVPVPYYLQETRLTKFVPVRISGVVDKKKIFNDAQFENLKELIVIYSGKHMELMKSCHGSSINHGNQNFHPLDIRMVKRLKVEKEHWVKAVSEIRNEINMIKKFDLIEPSINGLESLEKVLGKLERQDLKENLESIDNVLKRYETLITYFNFKLQRPSEQLSMKLRLKERTRLVLFYIKRLPYSRLEETYLFEDKQPTEGETANVATEIKTLGKLTLVLNELTKSFIEEDDIPEVMPFNHFMYNSSRLAS